MDFATFIQKLLKVEKKLVNYASHREFLKRCIDESIVPKGFILKWNICMDVADAEKDIYNKILLKSSFDLMTAAVETCEKNLKLHSFRSKQLKSEMKKMFDDEKMSELEDILNSVREKKMRDAEKRKQKKFRMYKNKINPKTRHHEVEKNDLTRVSNYNIKEKINGRNLSQIEFTQSVNENVPIRNKRKFQERNEINHGSLVFQESIKSINMNETSQEQDKVTQDRNTINSVNPEENKTDKNRKSQNMNPGNNECAGKILSVSATENVCEQSTHQNKNKVETTGIAFETNTDSYTKQKLPVNQSLPHKNKLKVDNGMRERNKNINDIQNSDDKFLTESIFEHFPVSKDSCIKTKIENLNMLNRKNEDTEIDKMQEKKTIMNDWFSWIKTEKIDKKVETYDDPRGFRVRKIIGDGHCFFRAISLEITGTQNHHLYLRKNICIEIEKNRNIYESYITGNFEKHIKNIRMTNGRSESWATEAEIKAAANLFGCNINVLMKPTNSPEIWQTFQPDDSRQQCKNYEIFLQHTNNDHFNLICQLTTVQNNKTLVPNKYEKDQNSIATSGNAEKTKKTVKDIEINPVFNLSKKTLTKEQEKLLGLGLKFIPTNRKIDMTELLADV